MNWENVRRLVEAASEIDWTKDGEYNNQTGIVGGKAMSNEMIRLLPAEGVETEDTEERLQQALSETQQPIS